MAARSEANVANQKLMIYVPPEVRRAVKLFAVDEARTVSDVFVDAVCVYLLSRGREIAQVPVPGANLHGDGSANLKPIIELLDRQETLLARVVERLDRPSRQPRSRDETVETAARARAMSFILAALTEAGSTGLTPGGLNKVARVRDLDPDHFAASKEILRANGLIRCLGNRWSITT